MKALKMLSVVAGAVALTAGSASAVVVDSFTFNNVDSFSGMEMGAATGNYTVAGYRVSGTLSEIDTGTWATEAEIDATVNAATTRLDPFSGTANFTDSVMVSNHVTLAGPTAVVMGDMYSFDFLETFDDGGVGNDATWDTITIEVLDLVLSTSLMETGSIGSGMGTFFGLSVISGGQFVIDTNGSNFDTELGVWDASGLLLGNDDDSGGGLNSRLNLDLMPGDYTIGIGGWNTVFSDGPTMDVSGDSSSGNYVLNVNSLGGEARFIDDVDRTVVPEPVTGMLGLMGLGAVAGSTRRRRA